jgi:aminopeptidase N
MLRGAVGTENFWRGIKSYYKKYQNANATSEDFRREMEEVSGKDLTVFFKQWLNQGGALKYDGNWKYNKDKNQIIISMDQVQKDGSHFEMPLEVGIYFEGQDQPKIEIIQLNEKSNFFTINVDAEPIRLVLDPNTWVLMDAEFRKSE